MTLRLTPGACRTVNQAMVNRADAQSREPGRRPGGVGPVLASAGTAPGSP